MRTLPPRNEFSEEGYLLLHPDVAAAIRDGIVDSGWQHFTLHVRRSEAELVGGKHQYGLNPQQIADLLHQYHQKGFGYVDYTPGSGYGISLALPSFVLSNFVQLPRWQLLGYHESGWDKRQDVISLQRLKTGNR